MRRSRSHRTDRPDPDRDPFGFAAIHADIERAMRDAFDGADQGRRAARDARAAHLRHMRRMRNHRGPAVLGHAGPPVWAYWWLVFPLVFGVLPALGFEPRQIAERWGDSLAALSPANIFAPLVDLFAGLTGLREDAAAAVLIAALLVNGAAVVIALRMRR